MPPAIIVRITTSLNCLLLDVLMKNNRNNWIPRTVVIFPSASGMKRFKGNIQRFSRYSCKNFINSSGKGVTKVRKAQLLVANSKFHVGKYYKQYQNGY